MNKFISTVVGSFMLGAVLSPKAAAVVPSPLSLQEGGSPAQEGVAESSAPRTVGQVADKLEEDQRRLEGVLQDLRLDQQALQHAARQTDSKENRDGLSLP